MHSVNLDLLRTASTRHGEAHAHHREVHLSVLRAARRQRWQDRIGWLRALLARSPARVPQPCPDHQT